MGETGRYFAKTYQGLEQVLIRELEAMGATQIETATRGVHFQGSKALLYMANLRLRTAARVLKEVCSFRAWNEEGLYNAVRDIDWGKYIGFRDSLAVSAVTHSEVFRHSHYAALKVKDAIVDQFRDKVNRRPNVNTENPTLRVHVHINDRDCSISLDSTGDGLYWRGWRQGKEEGQFSDAMTAGLLMLGWDGKSTLLDGIVSNGQTIVEAAMLATGMAPGLSRDVFAFQKWRDYEEELFLTAKARTAEEMRNPNPPTVVGWDRSPMSLNVAKRHLDAAGLSNAVSLEKKAFDREVPGFEPGTLFLRFSEENPDYYKALGDILKHQYTGWKVCVVGPEGEGIRALGLRADKSGLLSDGRKEFRWVALSIYPGSGNA